MEEIVSKLLGRPCPGSKSFIEIFGLVAPLIGYMWRIIYNHIEHVAAEGHSGIISANQRTVLPVEIQPYDGTRAIPPKPTTVHRGIEDQPGFRARIETKKPLN